MYRKWTALATYAMLSSDISFKKMIILTSVLLHLFPASIYAHMHAYTDAYKNRSIHTDMYAYMWCVGK